MVGSLVLVFSLCVRQMANLHVFLRLSVGITSCSSPLAAGTSGARKVDEVMSLGFSEGLILRR